MACRSIGLKAAVGGAWPLPAGGLAAPPPLGSAALLPPAWGLLLRLMIQQVTAQQNNCKPRTWLSGLAASGNADLPMPCVMRYGNSGTAACPGCCRAGRPPAAHWRCWRQQPAAPWHLKPIWRQQRLRCGQRCHPGCRGAWEAARHATAVPGAVQLKAKSRLLASEQLDVLLQLSSLCTTVVPHVPA